MRTVGSWFKLLLVGADGMIGTRKNDLFHSCLPGRLKHMIRPDDIVVQHGFPGAIDSRARSQVHHTLHPWKAGISACILSAILTTIASSPGMGSSEIRRNSYFPARFF